MRSSRCLIYYQNLLSAPKFNFKIKQHPKTKVQLPNWASLISHRFLYGSSSSWQCRQVLFATLLQQNIVYIINEHGKPDVVLSLNGSFGCESFAKIFQVAQDELIPFLKLLRTNLLDERIDLSVAANVDEASKMALLTNKIIFTCWPTEQPMEVLMIVRDLIFSGQLPNRVKFYLQEAFNLCMELDQKEQYFIIETSLRGMIELLRRCDGIKLKIYSDKEGRQFAVQVDEGQSFVEKQQFILATIGFMLNVLPKIQARIAFSLKIFSLVRATPYFQQNYFSSNRLPSLLTSLNFIYTTLEKLLRIDCFESRNYVLQGFLNSVDMHNVIEFALSYGAVRHSVQDSLCFVCVSSDHCGEEKEILEAKRLAFTLIEMLYKAASTRHCLKIFNEKGEYQLIEMILNGLRCFHLLNNAQQTIKQILSFLEVYDNIAALTLQIYIWILKLNHKILPSLFVPSQKLKQLLLMQLLSFNKYEAYLFDHEPERFFELVWDMCSQKQLDAIKSKTAKLIHLAKQILPQSQQYFINAARYHLQKNNNVYLREWPDIQHDHRIAAIPTESCYLLLCMFVDELQSTRDQSFFRCMVQTKCLEKMNDLGFTMTLIFLTMSNLNIFSQKPYNMHLVDFGLKSNHPTLKLAALKYLQKVSHELYSPTSFSILSKEILEGDTNQQVYLIDKWIILGIILGKHYNKLTIYSKSYVLSGVRKQISQEIIKYLRKKALNEPIIFQGIQLCMKILDKLDYANVHPFMKKCLLDIACFWEYVPSKVCKAELAKIIGELLLIYKLNGSRIPNKILNLLPKLLEYYQQTQDTQMLTIFDCYISLLQKDKKATVSVPIVKVLFESFMKQLNQCASGRQNAITIYSSLVLLQNYVLYLGWTLQKREILTLVTKCREIQKDSQWSVMIRTRAMNTTFACCLSLSQEQLLFQTVFMLREVKSCKFQSLQVEMLLKTIEVCVTTNINNGSLANYRWIIGILFQLSLYSDRFRLQTYHTIELGQIFDYFVPSCSKKEDIQRQCYRVYQQFRIHKNLAYLYVMDVLDPFVRDYFLALEKNNCDDAANPSVKSYIKPFTEQCQWAKPSDTLNGSEEEGGSILWMVTMFSKLLA